MGYPISDNLLQINRLKNCNSIWIDSLFFYSALLRPIFLKQQFILMATHTSISFFHTPDKRSFPDPNSNRFSTAITQPRVNFAPFQESPATIKSSQFRPANQREEQSDQKLRWFQMKTEELRVYLNESSEIDKNYIKHIFEWQISNQRSEEQQQKILKDLSHKVKALIKENHELRHYCSNEEWVSLKKENEALKAMIDQFHRGEAARENILSEENRYLREYIERHQEDVEKQFKSRQLAHNSESELKLDANPPSFDIPSEQNISNLRKYILTYVNTVIEANDEQFQAQRKYIDTLQKRISEVDKFKSHLQHLSFQRSVKLQESNRKSKNFSIGAPNIPGDRFEYDPQSPQENKLESQQNKHYFKSKTFQQDNASKPNKEMVSLVLRSAKLQQQLTNLQQKYEIEIENHIRDTANQQELHINIQKLNAEKNELKHYVFELQSRLKLSESKLSDVQRTTSKKRLNDRELLIKNSPFSIKEELRQIKNELKSCGFDKFEAVERQIAQLLLQRNTLKKELLNLQKTIAQSSKFSSTQKELFLLKQRNAQLEQNCRFYQQQIVEYQKQLRLISQENEKRLAKDISKDFREMNDKQKMQELSWPKLAHECIANSINRLENIEKQLSISSQQ